LPESSEDAHKNDVVDAGRWSARLHSDEKSRSFLYVSTVTVNFCRTTQCCISKDSDLGSDHFLCSVTAI